ncbi:MAG: LamG-like jellyroll fold domain-containing protein, partial [Bacteroidota bacterium]
MRRFYNSSVENFKAVLFSNHVRVAMLAIAGLSFLLPNFSLAQRVSSGLVTLYDFTESSGTTVEDKVGNLDLHIQNQSNTNWLSGCGLSIHTATILESSGNATALKTALQGTNEITIEAWIKPANTSQTGPARIVTMSPDWIDRNFTLGQSGNRYATRLRTGNNNGLPEIVSPAASVGTNLQHVVYSREHSGEERIYIDGSVVYSGTRTGDFSNFVDYPLAIANEVGGSRAWLGEIYLVAIYSKDLSSSEVSQNFAAGPCPSVNIGGSCSIEVRAKGTCGSETIDLRYDDVTVATFTLTSSLANYTYSGGYGGQDIKVVFTNDGSVGACDKNVQIDHIRINGATFQTSTNGIKNGCGPQNDEWLFCDHDFFDYGALGSCSNGSVINTVVPDENFSFDCDDGVQVDIYGSGVNCSNNPDSEVTIPNPSNVFQVVVEIVYKNQNPGSSVTVQTDNGDSYVLNQVSVSGMSSNVRVYRGVIPQAVSTVGHNSETNGCGNNNGLQSLVAYAFRNVAIKRSSSGVFTGISGFCDFESFDIPIPTDNSPRDVTINVPISEMTPDGRHMVVTATAGGVTNSVTIFGPDGDCCLNIPAIFLANVPGSTSTATITIDTRPESDPNSPQNCGQSYVIAGLAFADIDCTTVVIGSDFGDAPESYGDICYTVIDANTTRLGSLVDTEAGMINSNDAQGDDNDGQDDEDGVTFSNSGNWEPGSSQTVTVSWSTNDVQGHIFGWVDFDGNGTFDNDEQVITNLVVGSGVGSDNYGGNRVASGTKTITFTVPSNADCGNTYARFTINSDLSTVGPTGTFCSTNDPSEDGEVEDYQVTIENVDAGTISSDQSGCSPFDPSNLTGTNVGSGVTYRWQSRPGTSGSWTNISGATGQNYNPPSLTQTTQFRRQARANSNCPFVTSNVVTITVNPLPTVTANANQTVCLGESVTLSATVSGGTNPVNLTWTPGNLTGATISVTPSATTTYTVTAVDANGCTDTDQVTVTVNPTPLVNISCPSDPFTSRIISNSPSCNNSGMYGLYTDDLLGDNTPLRFFAVQGAATLQEFSNGTAVISFTAVNTVNSNLVFEVKGVYSGRTFTAPPGSPKENEQCIGDIDNSDWYYYTTLEGQLTGLNGLAGAKVLISRKGPSFQIGTGANLNDANVFGASGWLMFQTLSEPDDANFSFKSSPSGGDFNINLSGASLQGQNDLGCLTICAGESTTLTANVIEGSGVSFLWSTGATTPSITVTPGTTTDYSVVITDSNGCTASDEATVTVNPVPTVDAGNNRTICVGGSTTLTATPSGGTGPFTYTWMPGNLSGASVNVSPTTTTTYTVTIEDANGCTNTDQVTVTVVADPTVDVNVDNAEICVGGSATLTATVSGGTGNVSFQWQSRQGTSGTFTNISGATNATLNTGSLSTTTQYRVRVTV